MTDREPYLPEIPWLCGTILAGLIIGSLIGVWCG